MSSVVSDDLVTFVDERGARWRAPPDARPFLESGVAPWVARDGAGAPLVAIKRSKRRDVYAASLPDAPPLLLKRYPPRTGLLGRGRDRLRTRAAAEFAMARRLGELGLVTPRPLGFVEPARTNEEPSWFVGTRLVGALPLGSYLEQRFRPGDGASAKFSLARRALDSLRQIHDAGIWHRDFHGGNLLLHEGEGPAARLHLVDLHSAFELGAVPRALRARDAADLLHSLRYAFSNEEVEELVAEAPRFALEADALRRAWTERRDRHARSRGARAFVESSRFAQAELGGTHVSHDRELTADDALRLVADHRAACELGDERVVRIGRRSRLTRQRTPSGRAVVVKEFVGSGSAARARENFANGVAAQARDLAVAAPLAVVTDADRRGFAIAAAVDDATPLHLIAQRAPRDAVERARAAAIARQVLELLVALVRRRFVHPDLSPKNLLVRTRARDDVVELLLVDLDPARPGARWTRAQLLVALAQLGDVSRRAFSTPQRLRFLDALRERLGWRGGRGPLARATARLLARRQKLRLGGAPRLELAQLARMRTLHLFGNWKWTGPADPAVALAAALAPGAKLLLGSCPFADLGQPVAEKAAARGVPHERVDALQKHWNPLRTGGAAAAVVTHARAHEPAVVHVHLDADHAAAVAAARSLATDARPAAIVRSVHAAGPHAPRTRRLLDRAELLVAPTHGLARALERELGRPPFDVALLETSVDLGRFTFDPARRARGRARLGLASDDVAFGIVARIQSHRNWELLFETWARLKSRAASSERVAKLVVLGRGTLADELAREPVRRLGLDSLVLLPGYQEGEAYVEALAACDVGLFLVPGTDVSCRAVREWMAASRPVVVSRRAPLPELVEDGVDGRVAEETVDALAAAVVEFSARERATRAGERALAKARRRFDPTNVAAAAKALDRLAWLALPGAAANVASGGRGAIAPSGASPFEVVAAVRPGRLDAIGELLAREGTSLDRLLAFDPRRSRDAVLDLFALVGTVRPRLVLLEPFDEFDATIARELARSAPETWVVRERGLAPGSATMNSPIARAFPNVEA